MTYKILKFIFRIALKIYFRKIKINYLNELPTNQPILFVSNHQSSFMDALLIAAMLDRPLNFMSRGESFNTPLKRWIFKQFNMNPIYRKEHSPDLISKNQSLIQGFQRLLLKKHSVLIFPEGISHNEPRLYPIKTGAARVILGAQVLADHDIFLVPIGLNYENPHCFRSKVLINFGKSVKLEAYNIVFSKNERKAVQLLTDRIGFELEQLTLTIENDELNNLVPVIQSIYEAELIRESPIALPKEKKAFHIRKDLIQGMHFFEKCFPKRSKRIKKSLQEYEQLLLNYRIKGNWLDANFNKASQIQIIRNIFFYLAGLPVFLYGLINHLGIFKLPPLIAESIIKRPDFRGSLTLSFGVMCFVFFYSLQISLVALMTKSFVWTLVYSISLPLTGSFVIYYFRKLRKDKEILDFKWSMKNNSEILQTLIKYREQILQQLRLARQDYLAFTRKV